MVVDFVTRSTPLGSDVSNPIPSTEKTGAAELKACRREFASSISAAPTSHSAYLRPARGLDWGPIEEFLRLSLRRAWRRCEACIGASVLKRQRLLLRLVWSFPVWEGRCFPRLVDLRRSQPWPSCRPSLVFADCCCSTRSSGRLAPLASMSTRHQMVPAPAAHACR